MYQYRVFDYLVCMYYPSMMYSISITLYDFHFIYGFHVFSFLWFPFRHCSIYRGYSCKERRIVLHVSPAGSGVFRYGRSIYTSVFNFASFVRAGVDLGRWFKIFLQKIYSFLGRFVLVHFQCYNFWKKSRRCP